MNYGDSIRQHRLEAGYTIKYLSYVTGISEQTIRSVEKGKHKSSMPVIIKIADALKLSLDEMLGREVKKGARHDGER